MPGTSRGRRTAARDEFERRNRELYDDTSSTVWRLAVYDAIHDGWEFVNLGGRHLLDAFARGAAIGPDTRVLELCSGQAATCRYLVERSQCLVTGVELNRRQVEQARLALAQAPAATSARVRLVRADVTTWRTPRRYDAALCFDSLMLLPQPGEALTTAAAALKEGGLLMVAVITAGPALDARLRQYLRDNDGMVSILRSDEYADLLRAAGFDDVEQEDCTALAAAASESMLAAFDRARDAILRSTGEDDYRASREAAVIYLEAFREGRLAYSVLTGHRSGAAGPRGRSGQDRASLRRRRTRPAETMA